MYILVCYLKSGWCLFVISSREANLGSKSPKVTLIAAEDPKLPIGDEYFCDYSDKIYDQFHDIKSATEAFYKRIKTSQSHRLAHRAYKD